VGRAETGDPAVKLLLDSVILIDHFNGIAAATGYLSAHHPDAAVSVITRAEVLTGFTRPASKRAAEFLDCFPTLGIDQAIVDLAATLRRAHGWRLPDAFQAAIARHHRLRLVTRNRRDFAPERHRFVDIPYQV
jgi:predicted nucleic acid-binding protein